MAGSSSGRAQKAPPSRPDAPRDAPVKIDPIAPPPAPEAAMVRAKASRPTFRRGGLAFNDRDWTVIGSEIGEEDLRAITDEPVLTIQVRGPGGEWLTLSAEQRLGLTASIPAAAD